MKAIAAYILALAGIATAHYTFPSLIIDGQVSKGWEFIRRTSNYQHTGPVQNVNSGSIRCYEDSNRPAAQIASVAAGSSIGFSVYYSITHPGPLLVYMAKVPAGKTAADWDGSGRVWFKISELAPTTYRVGFTKVPVTLPSSLPSGDYLIRVEHIALHSAGGQGGAQFYLACGQLNVTGGGNGTPGPLVSFPGAYSPTDPGILINLDWPIPTSYTMPGPRTTGPISIAAYMRQCLTDPKLGYYTSRGTSGSDVFGRKGDFVTSPEISQIFGELLGIWIVTEWMAQGRPSSGVQLIEIGPGKGTLMADILRSVQNFKAFASSIETVYLVEASPTLRDTQLQVLCGDSPVTEDDIGCQSTSSHIGVPIIWAEHIRDVPNGADAIPFIIAHEFFDALPIHAFQSVASPFTGSGPNVAKSPGTSRQPISSAPTQWRELVVSMNPESRNHKDKEQEFRLSLAKSATPASLVMPEMSPRYQAMRSTRGSTIEISPESHAYIQEIARRIGGPANDSNQGGISPSICKPAGAALILDYGPASNIPINSLRGIKSHKIVSPFTSPGKVDLSVDVDFTALAEAALNASPEVEVYGPTEQGSFLQSLGIEERAAQLLRTVKDQSQKNQLELGWKRLVSRSGGGMGGIYKAMAIVPGSEGKRRPVGFGGQVVV
ncbi:hypothetical protein FQN57_003164 [Myotisia sp. PD_48]|nr:hypothetical protein FQN57_003164 [Myotisia sp. PD_48]